MPRPALVLFLFVSVTAACGPTPTVNPNAGNVTLVPPLTLMATYEWSRPTVSLQPPRNPFVFPTDWEEQTPVPPTDDDRNPPVTATFPGGSPPSGPTNTTRPGLPIKPTLPPGATGEYAKTPTPGYPTPDHGPPPISTP